MSSFLYPFLHSSESDASEMLKSLAESTQAKAAESATLQFRTVERESDMLDALAEAMALRFRRGGRLLTFGNGGSSTDADSLAVMFRQPPSGVALPARTLGADTAILTALGNDIGYDNVFARQLVATGVSVDIALAVSTSGGSKNLLRALEEAHALGLLTVALAGYGGGALAGKPWLDHCLTVESDSVHRIQETQAALGYVLWQRVQSRIQEGVMS